MKAISFARFGGIDELRMTELPDPRPGKDEVVVEVMARSINVIDGRVRRGEMGPLVSKKFPKIPGSDLVGTVIAAGADVRDLAVGTRVFGATDPLKGGSFAERVAVPARQLSPLPPTIGDEDAAALPVAGLAALYSLRELGGLKPGGRVLIHGASGPVGLYAVQLAKLMGGDVTAVGGEGIALARDFGADVAIDYRAQPTPPLTGPFDLILNASGKMPYARGKELLGASGRLIEPSPTIAVFIGSKLANLFRRRRHLMLATITKRDDLAYLADLVAQARLKPLIAARFALGDARDAFALAEKGGLYGKVIVTN